MATAASASMGDRGRLVIPAELRVRQQWARGTPLLFIETSRGVLMTTREQAKELIRRQLAGGSLVAELIDERRREAANDAA